MPAYVPYLIAAAGLPSSVFAYLRYRSYVDLVKHIVDKEGVGGLRATAHVVGPWRSPVGPITVRKQLRGEVGETPPTPLGQAG